LEHATTISIGDHDLYVPVNMALTPIAPIFRLLPCIHFSLD